MKDVVNDGCDRGCVADEGSGRGCIVDVGCGRKCMVDEGNVGKDVWRVKEGF